MKLPLRERFAGERGFTLIELLVVILIIGILAAIAIPSFLNQKSKAFDAAAKELAHSAQTAAETYATDKNGSYAGMTAAVLQAYEATLVSTGASGGAYLNSAGGVSNVTATSYTITATSASGETFSINRTSTGIFTRTCAPVSKGGCSAAGTW